ncbi:shikimate dehydrogenase [Virgibacillus litoralis]|uniref:Shikimate dehydrogenase (NADP(+)) n=1 Tax=Virgibacillus litoralis TaxID=578221 RepID=A0ABS4H9L8_9BACI|nr:shikimate dehydrogenase [Virgibacillus litoralis]MBP1947606.1 shikimate dehydrogenase [Virgibacillus litoralis]
MHMKLGLIGFPIKHSLSPWIHNQFLEKSGMKGTYSIMEISPDNTFEQELERIKESGLDGFNVTVPYKKQIINYLDDLDKNAEIIGAVNTVVCKNGKWIGYNTDGIGYVIALRKNFPEIFHDKKNRILIFGAGGAAYGIYYGLKSEGFTQIDIANRTHSSAKAIAILGDNNVETSILSLDEAQESINSYNLIIQTTSVGMKPNTEDTIIPIKSLNQKSVVSDIIYQPLNTRFLMDAKKTGASIHYGHTMLLYQAQYAFELWTNKKIPIDNMDQQLKTILEGR